MISRKTDPEEIFGPIEDLYRKISALEKKVEDLEEWKRQHDLYFHESDPELVQK